MASDKLIEEWFDLTRETMPSLASDRGWPVQFDHCFQRILLDNAVGGKWKDAIASPAYRNATDVQLQTAIELGRKAVSGEKELGELNRKSLAWRGKLGG
ncbi:GCN5-related N-acetyltransferase [Erythrobacter litoralis]|uniref:GCN5-related N-acetyltransferase n=1 Tax=Erythrobacter litoralis TaxID=39960 RepID=UPI002435BBFE|nr:GCN5-related N-acetyltransferase [Erythrobacter litoralis]MDG6078436.1 GCN5-related N-acetyltransferase [Erythrobacter litoralis]